MKKLFILLLLAASSLQAQAETSARTEVLEQLKSFSSKDLAADVVIVKEKKGDELHIDKMFKTLEAANKLIVNDKITGDEELVKEMERVALLTFQHDPSQYAAEIIVPSFQKDKLTFKKAAKSLSATQSKRIIDSLRNTERAVEGLDG